MKQQPSKVYTITFGDVAENHARMQKIGRLAESGYSIKRLENLATRLERDGVTCEYVDLSSKWIGDDKVVDAGVLVIRKGLNYVLGDTTQGIIAEHDNLDMDKHAFMRGRVVRKHARWNLCFADNDQEPKYEDGKGSELFYDKLIFSYKMLLILLYIFFI